VFTSERSKIRASLGIAVQPVGLTSPPRALTPDEATSNSILRAALASRSFSVPQVGHAHTPANLANSTGQAIFTLPQGNYRFRADKNGTQCWSGVTNHCPVPGCTRSRGELQPDKVCLVPSQIPGRRWLLPESLEAFV
jgi:hypothetical protein